MATRKTSKSAATGKAAQNVRTSAAPDAVPPVQELKDAFKAGSVPLQGDYYGLIEMAAAATTAVGLSVDDPGVGLGLKLSGTKLTLFTDPNRCLLANADGVGIVVAADQGLAMGTDGIEVKTAARNGTTVNGDGICIKLAPNNVLLRLTNDGLAGWLASGMITMFAGDNPPEYWAICDGQNGTPNLISQFIKDEQKTTRDGRDRYSLTYIMLTEGDPAPSQD